MNRELLEAVTGVCRRVQRLVACYEEDREPDKLDCLVFHVDLILLAFNVNMEVLEAVGTGLGVLNRQSTGIECGTHPR